MTKAVIDWFLCGDNFMVIAARRFTWHIAPLVITLFAMYADLRTLMSIFPHLRMDVNEADTWHGQ